MTNYLVTESQARLDLAGEYGILFANFRNISLEHAALSNEHNRIANELEGLRALHAQLNEKYREVIENRDELANQLRGKAIKPRKV